jgi:hypothetical protein
MKKEAAAMVVVFLLISGSLSYVIYEQYTELVRLRSDYNKLSSDFRDLESENEGLNEQNLRLTGEKTALENESEALKAKINVLQKDITAAAKLIDFYTATINESIQWFRENSNIKTVEDSRIRWQLKQHCIRMDPDTCKIRLGCFPFVNDYLNEIKYEPDILTGRADYLKNLSLILESKGGDCEDISLLFAAEYNYLAEECLKNRYSRSQIRLYSYIPDNILKYSISYDEESEIKYFIPKAKSVDVSEGDNYIYIVCGTFAGQEFGHCVIAVSSSEIRNSQEVYSKLDRAALIEPQNGMLIGYINDGSIRLYDNGEKPFNSYFIYVIILDEDMLLFNWRYEDKFLYNWIGYKDFKDILFVLKSMLEK